MAEGFLHDFEGWVVFMACTALLVVEMAVLAKVGSDRKSFSEAFGLEFPAPTPVDGKKLSRKAPTEFLLSIAVIAALFFSLQLVGERTNITPARTDFAAFPLDLGEWKGKAEPLEQIYVDELHLDDYALIDFTNRNHGAVNFYAAYYDDQNKGKAIHSPRTCLPGGGWLIDSFSQATITDVTVNNTPLRVNRVVIKRGDYTQLVYYWFQQRGRVVTNEYLVKWYILWDALTRKRTDGALVRLTTLVRSGEDISEADSSLTAFAKEVSPLLTQYIPD